MPNQWTHQIEHVERFWNVAEHALFWEPGVGKSRPIIETAARCFRAGLIDCIIIVTDPGAHSNWVVEEVPRWMPDDILYESFEYTAQKADTKTHERGLDRLFGFHGLAILAMSHDAIITERGKKTLWRFLKYRKVLYVADESIFMKTPSADRTKVMLKSGQYAKMRRVLNGTPVDRDPRDVYSQIMFLRPTYWEETLGLNSKVAFDSEFCVTQEVKLSEAKGGRTFKKILQYKNIDRLQAAMKGISSRYLKEDVLDLPPKVYTWKFFEMSGEQARIYNKLKAEALADIGEEQPCVDCQGEGYFDDEACFRCEGGGVVRPKTMTAILPIVRMLRMQQILSSYMQADDEPISDIPGPNRRLEALEQVLTEVRGPHIIFSRFRRDVEKIEGLCRDMGLRYGRYDGTTPVEERTRIRSAFQAGELDAIDANVAIMAKAVTLTMAQHVCYYNNHPRLLLREQSEDRPHRGGLDHTVTYTDIACAGTLDVKTVRDLRAKKDIARAVTGDRLREWLI